MTRQVYGSARRGHPPGRHGLLTCAPDRLALVSGGPLDLVVEVAVGEIRRRPSRIDRMRIDTVLRTGYTQIAEGSGWLRCIDPGVYRRLRRTALPHGPGTPPPVPAMPPDRVGRAGTGNVVIGPAGGTRRGYPLRVLTDHPVFFDHALDHVPGMLAIEALRQAAVVGAGLPGARLTAVDAQFDGFLELDRDCTVIPRVRTEQRGGWDVLVDIEQNERSVVRGSVSLTS
ncbi:MAG TPA: AfsA-related hotdog domain-containing protein [Actinoplanes sp.]|nr:AfsA-related hotdog domain-containing protein [Actinoplanes sp.]